MANKFPIYEPQGNAFLNTNNDPAVTDFKEMNNSLANAFGDNNSLGNTGGALGSLAGPAGAVAGNLAGTTLSYFLGNQQAKNQMRNQKKLMQEQHKLQMEQQFMAPQLQKLGMEAAGMNPADGSYTQATPQVPGASAPIPQMANMSNIFDGLTEMITALKAPTEIEKMVADTELSRAKTGESEAQTGKTNYETWKLLPKTVEQINKNIDLTSEQIKNAKNLNDVFEAENKFLKEQSSAIFDNYIEHLRATGEWKTLPEQTQNTLMRLATGEITLGKGELEAFNKLVDSQANLSNRDKEMLSNARDMAVLSKQLKDNGVLEAMAKLPETERNKVLQDIKESQERVLNLIEERKRITEDIEKIKASTDNIKQNTELQKAQEKLTKLNYELEEIGSPEYLLYKKEWGKLMAVTGAGTAKLAAQTASKIIQAKANPLGAMKEMATVQTTTKSPDGKSTTTITRHEPVKSFSNGVKTTY